jgi:FKBP-type peptidyl-prolyl cis-trans isomerase
MRPTGLILLLLALGLGACGSSKAPGVVTAPGGGATTPAAVTTTSATATATSTTPAVSTPKPPSPLSTKPVVSVPSGPAPTHLVVKDLIKGTGATAKSGSRITVNYVGVLYKNGKEFDSSWKRNQTFPLTLGQHQVIQGWDQGLVGMKVGGRRELIIPANLAYGAAGSGSAIPPNSPLVFVVDLLAAS